MKVLNGQYYEVGNSNHNGVSCDRYDSIDDAVKGCIKDWADQRVNGWNNHNQVIFFNRWERIFDDDGTLISDNHSITYQEKLLINDYEDEIQKLVETM